MAMIKINAARSRLHIAGSVTSVHGQTPTTNRMKRYLVGGAVRDAMLGLPVTDRDWVVVGSTPQQMKAQGFRSVGKDFPVFLHPDTHEEHALARIERKTGPGYHGFEFDTSASVTLEEDLSRRDLTINAMAQTENGELIDPFNGAKDLEQRVLRHVSAAFSEDPVRILRVARFMSRYSDRGFIVHADTIALMKRMVANGEVDNLVAERVWQEMSRALAEPDPVIFIETLATCHALERLLPEVHALFGVPQKAKWHPEIDAGVHTLMVIGQASRHRSTAISFAALCHDLGKATTPEDQWPSHSGHEQRGATITENLCQRLRVPRPVRDLAVLSARYHTHCHRAAELKANTLVKTLKALDVIRKPERFADFLKVCEADARGRLGLEQQAYPQAGFMAEAADVLRQVETASVAKAQADKSRIAYAIHQVQVSAVKTWMSSKQ